MFSFTLWVTWLLASLGDDQQPGAYTRGTHRIVWVKYQFGRHLIPSEFLKRIVTSNFRDMRNLINACRVRIAKNVVLGIPIRGQL